MLDSRGYRLNIGIILTNGEEKLFLGKRAGSKDSWQFPQGGMQPYETLEEAMYRELKEEIGLTKEDVEILAVTRHWLYYQLPHNLQREQHSARGVKRCLGQKQRWFLLKLVSDEKNISFDHTDTPEFDGWRWVDYWYPLQQVIYFKQQVYEKVLTEFEKEMNLKGKIC